MGVFFIFLCVLCVYCCKSRYFLRRPIQDQETVTTVENPNFHFNNPAYSVPQSVTNTSETFVQTPTSSSISPSPTLYTPDTPPLHRRLWKRKPKTSASTTNTPASDSSTPASSTPASTTHPSVSPSSPESGQPSASGNFQFSVFNLFNWFPKTSSTPSVSPPSHSISKSASTQSHPITSSSSQPQPSASSSSQYSVFNPLGWFSKTKAKTSPPPSPKPFHSENLSLPPPVVAERSVRDTQRPNSSQRPSTLPSLPSMDSGFVSSSPVQVEQVPDSDINLVMRLPALKAQAHSIQYELDELMNHPENRPSDPVSRRRYFQRRREHLEVLNQSIANVERIKSRMSGEIHDDDDMFAFNSTQL